jgi:hypothetical protein
MNNLVDLYFTHNMVPFSIALYKILGIDMSSDNEMIKMQLHAQDYVDKIKEDKSKKNINTKQTHVKENTNLNNNPKTEMSHPKDNKKPDRIKPSDNSNNSE